MIPSLGIVFALEDHISVAACTSRIHTRSLPFFHGLPGWLAYDFREVAAPPGPSLWTWQVPQRGEEFGIEYDIPEQAN